MSKSVAYTKIENKIINWLVQTEKTIKYATSQFSLSHEKTKIQVGKRKCVFVLFSGRAGPGIKS